ncbi:MAG TPA: 3-alpha domain-containing protein, partial [Pyrinomonadaceae bacterium]|nr:3-alpha domain-containing protein [Pyrinomonadaceae bacterium]
VRLLSRDENDVTIADIVRLYAFEKDDLETLRRAVKLNALSQSWREYFQERLRKLERHLEN